MRGINSRDLVQHVIHPVLNRLRLNSPAAVNLLLGTALTESLSHFLTQKPRGPAVGIYQMEPDTYYDVYSHWLDYRPELLQEVRRFRLIRTDMLGPMQMAGNLYYATALARVQYRRIPEALPEPNDAHGLAGYWKDYWNTKWGAGRVEQATPHFIDAIRVTECLGF